MLKKNQVNESDLENEDDDIELSEQDMLEIEAFLGEMKDDDDSDKKSDKKSKKSDDDDDEDDDDDKDEVNESQVLDKDHDKSDGMKKIPNRRADQTGNSLDAHVPTKVEMVKNVMHKMMNMSKGEVKSSFDRMFGTGNHDQLPKSFAKEDIDLKDDVKALFGNDESLTEDFINNSTEIFESAVINKVNEFLGSYETNISEMVEERVAEKENEIWENVDVYLDYVVQEWIENNKVEAESLIKSEFSESFLQGLHDLFETHYVNVPEEKIDVVEELTQTNVELEESVNAQIEKNRKIIKENEELKKEKLIKESSEGLSDLQIDKLVSLTENVDFESEEAFNEKIGLIKERYFEKTDGEEEKVYLDEEVDIEEGTEVINENKDVSAVVNALSRFSKSKKI